MKKRMQFSAVKELRLKLGMTQQAFWNHLGITQSGGCRYESGRRVPNPTRMLIELVYFQHGERYLKRLRSEAGVDGRVRHSSRTVSSRRSPGRGVPGRGFV